MTDPSEKALAPLAPTAVEGPAAEIKRLQEEVARDDATITRAMNRCMDDEEELASATKREQRIAREAQKPRKDVAFGLLAAHERELARTRKVDTSGPPLRMALVILPARREPQADDKVHFVDVEASGPGDEG